MPCWDHTSERSADSADLSASWSQQAMIMASARGGHSCLPPSGYAGFPRGGMPIPLRSIGCLPVVASLLPPGTALTRLRFAQLLLLLGPTVEALLLTGALAALYGTFRAFRGFA